MLILAYLHFYITILITTLTSLQPPSLYGSYFEHNHLISIAAITSIFFLIVCETNTTHFSPFNSLFLLPTFLLITPSPLLFPFSPPLLLPLFLFQNSFLPTFYQNQLFMEEEKIRVTQEIELQTELFQLLQNAKNKYMPHFFFVMFSCYITVFIFISS